MRLILWLAVALSLPLQQAAVPVAPPAGAPADSRIWIGHYAEFEEYLKEVAAGRPETLYDPRRMITSGPGFKRIGQSE